jgi:hypothetical protein
VPSPSSSVSAQPPISTSLSPSLVLDGVYRTTEGVPVFHAVRAPTAAELQVLLRRIIKRIMKFLTRKGFLIEDQGTTYLADTDRDTTLGPLQVAACTYRIAFGPRAGQKVLSLQTVPSQAAPSTEQRCVNEQGFEGTRRSALRRPSEEETREPGPGMGPAWRAEDATPVPLYHPPRRGQR